MGVDYRAESYLGVKIEKSDFVETVKDIEVVCDHDEAEGNAFCPVCGTKAKDRTVDVLREVPKENMAKYLEDWDEHENWEDWVHHAFEWESGLGGFQLRFGGDGYSGYDFNDITLSMKMGRTSSNRSGGGEDSIEATRVVGYIKQFQDKLLAMGLGSKANNVRLYTVLDIS